MTKRDQKIAEHIAKFNAPEGVFYWVSDESEGSCETYKEHCDLGMLMLYVDPYSLTDCNGVTDEWTYALRHTPTAPSKPHFLDGVPKLEGKSKATWKDREVSVLCEHSGFIGISVTGPDTLYWVAPSDLTPLPSLVPWDQKDFLAWLAENGMDDVWVKVNKWELLREISPSRICLQSDLYLYSDIAKAPMVSP
jgi:hypothetical protein